MNKLSFKDYLLIYMVILVIVAFITGFFIGAKAMENELKDTNYSSSVKTNSNYSENEITKFYYQIFSPARSYNLDIYELINNEDTISESEKQVMIDNGEELISNYEIYTFESPYLKNSVVALNDNLNSLIDILNNNNMGDITNTTDYYLSSQKNFYRSIWIWEQSLQSENNIIEETTLDWTTWKTADLHQKNYIVSNILETKSINTFYRPEDITVHIDSFIIKAENEVSISLEDVIILLISSDSIQEKDFLNYLNKYPDWYSSETLPAIPNFY